MRLQGQQLDLFSYLLQLHINLLFHGGKRLVFDDAFKARLDSLKKFTKGAPVNPFGDTLFTIYMRVGGYTAAERANSLNEKIRLIQEDKFYSPDSLLIIPGIITTDIVYKGILVLSITENDELIRDKTSDELARNYREEIIKSIGKYREENSLRFKLEKAGMVLIVLLVLVLIG